MSRLRALVRTAFALLALVAASMPAPAQRPPRPGLRPLRRRPMPEEAADALKGYGSGTHPVTVDAARTVGRIRSLLGTNRGPVSWERRSDRIACDHTEALKRFGVDGIRTHDFYGPTDWYVIFPDFSADPDDPAAYDFRSSDARIRPICERGFECLFRLGTSWRGPPESSPPINDPPGTVRDAAGRVVHEADRDDFRKWARICVHIIQHYTEGWNDGQEYPICYWEVWNEPDLREQFWAGRIEQYYVLYEEAARAIKAHRADLKVGGPACTGALRETCVQRFIQYCRDRKVPLDFFSWHSYGARGAMNPYVYRETASRIRQALDDAGFTEAENFCTEWNAGIKHRLISQTPAGAPFYASALAAMLDGGLDRAFQYCGDMHPGLGLFERPSGEPKICAYAFEAWKRLCETPHRLAATGADRKGYAVVAGRDEPGRRVRVLVSDFQSGCDGFALRVEQLPWADDEAFTVTCRVLDADHRLETVHESTGRGRTATVERAAKAPSVWLIEIERSRE